MAKIGDLVGKAVHRAPIKCDSLVLPWSKIGIEVEAENYTRQGESEILRTGLWDIKEDHSLRNNGMEFVTRGGLVGKDIESAVSGLCAWARKHKLDEGYPRAGIHVHLDCTDLELAKGELSIMLGMYLVVEHAMFSYAGDWRQHCGFCEALIANGQNRKNIRNILTGKAATPAKFVSAVRNMHRYIGVNLQSLRKFGTIEFRHLPTTFDSSRIMEWINIILQLKKVATEWNPSKNFVTEFHKLGAVKFTRTLMGDMWSSLAPHFQAKNAWRGIDAYALLTAKKAAPNWDMSAPTSPYLKNKMNTSRSGSVKLTKEAVDVEVDAAQLDIAAAPDVERHRAAIELLRTRQQNAIMQNAVAPRPQLPMPAAPRAARRITMAMNLATRDNDFNEGDF